MPNLADVGISGALPPALASSAVSMLCPLTLPCGWGGHDLRGRGTLRFHVPQTSPDDLGSPCTPAVYVSASGHFGRPELNCVPFWPKPHQSLWLVGIYDACGRSFNLTLSSHSSAPPGLRLPGWLHCRGGFRPESVARSAPAPLEYLWRNTGHRQELSMRCSEFCSFMSQPKLSPGSHRVGVGG